MKTEKNIKSDTVESLDRSRYVAMKWVTIGYVLFCGSLIARYLMESMGIDKIYHIISTATHLIGGLLFGVFIFRFTRIIKRINSNLEYKQILNDEYYASINYKVLQNSFISFIVVMFVAILVTMLYPSLPAIVVGLSIFLIVFICGMVSWLIYHR